MCLGVWINSETDCKATFLAVIVGTRGHKRESQKRIRHLFDVRLDRHVTREKRQFHGSINQVIIIQRHGRVVNIGVGG